MERFSWNWTYLFTHSGPCVVACQIDTYLYVRIESWDILIKKREQQPSQGDDASTVEGFTCGFGRGEQGEARPAISTPKGGPYLDLGSLRLKAESKSDFPNAGATWAAVSSMYPFSLCVPGTHVRTYSKEGWEYRYCSTAIDYDVCSHAIEAARGLLMTSESTSAKENSREMSAARSMRPLYWMLQCRSTKE